MNLPILMYHSVSNKVSSKFRRWVIPPALFAAHLNFLKQNGYTPLTVTEIAQAVKDPSGTLPKRVIGITFDDGFEDFYVHALPILEQFDFPSTLYVTSGFVGETSEWLSGEGEGERRMLNWRQIREIAQRGVEIGAHSLYHHQLDTLDLQHAKQEIAGSKALLEQRLEHEVTSFAYPHGYYSREVRELVIQSGFQSACAVKHGMSSLNDDPYALARIIVPGDASLDTLKSLLNGQGLVSVTNQERLATTVWRFIRRTTRQLNNTNGRILDAKGGNPSYGKRPNRG
jgi:peptidoglycan/xylan/chitin deacetylase (PgdA/CDA1 family)